MLSKLSSLFCCASCCWILLVISCTSDPDPVSDEKTEVVAAREDPTLAKLNQGISADPDNADLYAKRARVYYEREGYDEAIRDLNQALRIDSTNADHLHLLADVYLDYYKSRQALSTLQKAVDLYPERIPTLLKMSEFQLILKMQEESLKTIDRILKLDPQNAEAYYMMGRVFEERNDQERAINSYQSAVDNDPDLIDAWLKLGELFARRKSPIAIRYLDNAIRLDSTRLDVLFARATYYHDRGELDAAIRAYKNINRLHPQFADAYYNTGLAYMELDSVRQAGQQFDLTVKMSPTHYMGYFYRGLVAEMSGDNKSARQNYQQVLNLNPDFERAQQALQNLGTVR